MYNDNNISSKRDNNRSFAGLFLVALGAIYLLRQLDFFLFPSWLFSWPMILIIIGIATGIKHNFKNTGSFVMIAIGGIFLIGKIVSMSIYFFWPLVLICIGIRMLAGKNHHWGDHHWGNKMNYRNDKHADL